MGVPGGIPNRAKIFVNVKTASSARYRCAEDGITNDAAALGIATPLNALASGKKLRGDGMGKTIFMLTDGAGRFQFGHEQSPRPADGSTRSALVSVNQERRLEALF